MNPYYLDALAASIFVNDHCLVIRDLKTRKILSKFKPREIPFDALIVQKPNGSISFNAIDWLIANNVSVTILDWKGNIRAQILPEQPISNELRLAQYNAYQNRKVHLGIARVIIQTKLRRQREFLESLSTSYPEIDVPKLPLVSSRSEDFMRNSEARYAVSYFEQFGKVCKELGQDFDGRGMKNNMHANSLVNALLNYGYGILQTYTLRALNAIGFDNSLPFVHDLGRNRGLVFDVMELWRSNIDYAVIETLGQFHRIKHNVYRMNDDYQAMLSEDTAKLLFERVRFNLSLEEIILNSRILGRYMLGENRTLTFSLKPVEVKTVFETEEVKQSILTKSARELGMNKSSLWYQKKRLQDRGTVRLYNVSKHSFS